MPLHTCICMVSTREHLSVHPLCNALQEIPETGLHVSSKGCRQLILECLCSYKSCLFKLAEFKRLWVPVHPWEYIILSLAGSSVVT